MLRMCLFISMLHYKDKTKKAGTFTRQPSLFGFVGCVLRCCCNRNFGRFRGFRLRNSECQDTVLEFRFDSIGFDVSWQRETFSGSCRTVFQHGGSFYHLSPLPDVFSPLMVSRLSVTETLTSFSDTPGSSARISNPFSVSEMSTVGIQEVSSVSVSPS